MMQKFDLILIEGELQIYPSQEWVRKALKCPVVEISDLISLIKEDNQNTWIAFIYLPSFLIEEYINKHFSNLPYRIRKNLEKSYIRNIEISKEDNSNDN